MAVQDLRSRRDPVELRPNTHPTMPMLLVRDPAGNIIEETYFDASGGLFVELRDYPAVGQIAIIPPMGEKSILLPAGTVHGH